MEYILDDIEICECVGMFEDEYVYDIEMIDNTHTFIANDILVHNSVFVSMSEAINLLNWKHDELELILHISYFRLQPYFKECLDDYAKKFNVNNRQDFELEQIAKSTINLAKKMYIKNIVWEEGVFSLPETNLQPKGIDLARSTSPAFVRDKKIGIYKVIRYFFENSNNLNDREVVRMLRDMKEQFKLAKIEDISMSTSCNNYKKFVVDDTSTMKLVKGTPHGVKAAALHNYLLNQNSKYKKQYEMIKSGAKMRYYYTKNTISNEFAYMSGSYPKEIAIKYAPIDYDTQFEKCILNMINRFTYPLKLSKLTTSLTFRHSLI